MKSKVILLLWISISISLISCEKYHLKMDDEPIIKQNPTSCDEFIVPKNYKQVLVNVTMVPNSKILFSNLPKEDAICPGNTIPDTNLDISQYCKDDLSCTMFENIQEPFRFRAEQCAEFLYILILYPPENEDPTAEVSISAEYVDETPCYTVTGGIHEIVNSETECGKRPEDKCESTVRCALMSCQYPSESERIEKICIPRTFNSFQREEFCANSGLVIKEYGTPPLDQYGTITIALGLAFIFLMTCFCAGCWYNLRIYQNKKPPFSVPRFCPQCCFPQPRDSYNYTFEEEDESVNSFDVLDNQNRQSQKRGTTKYRAPNFYFEDE